jgi:hypothetical protein
MNASTVTINFSAGPAGGSSTSYSGGTIDATQGSSVDVNVSTFSAVPLNDLVVSNAPKNNGIYSVSNGKLSGVTESFSQALEQLTVTGTLSGLGNITFETFQLKPGSYLQGTTASAFTLDSTVFQNDVKSVTLGSDFASYLGVLQNANYAMISASGPSTGTNQYESTSATLNVTATPCAAPEPASLLLGLGVAGVGVLRRKRIAARRVQA